MTRHLALLVLSATLTFAGSAHADDDKRFAIGGDAQLIVPIGEFGSNNTVMFGPLLRLGYRVIPEVEISVRSGYLFGFDRQQQDAATNVTTNFSILPVWGGVRVFPWKPSGGVYAAAEVGANFGKGRTKGTILGTSVDQNTAFEGRYGFNLGVGYLSSALPIDLRAQFSYLNVLGNKTDGEKAALAFGFSAGYTVSF